MLWVPVIDLRDFFDPKKKSAFIRDLGDAFKEFDRCDPQPEGIRLSLNY